MSFLLLCVMATGGCSESEQNSPALSTSSPDILVLEPPADAGRWTAPDTTCSGPELCNSLDDDCDGETDEDIPTAACTNVIGCSGQMICQDGAYQCVPDAGVEVCNGADDDCDGDTDEEVNCDDGVACTQDTCEGTNGCVATAQIELCTVDSTCGIGVCDLTLGCVIQPIASPFCTDDDLCTTDDKCVDGACVGVGAPCDDLDPCTADGCDGDTGECTHVPTVGGACDDGNACTAGDTCLEDGGCLGTTDTDCSPDEPCMVGTCDPITGDCEMVERKCKGSSCAPGTCDPTINDCVQLPLDCDDDNQCTLDYCETGKCKHSPMPYGSACGPGPCGFGICTSIGCSLLQPESCDDDNPCTADSCGNGKCIFTPIGGTCEKPPCIVNGSCQDGQCVGDVGQVVQTLPFTGTPGVDFWVSVDQAGWLRLEQPTLQFHESHPVKAIAVADAEDFNQLNSPTYEAIPGVCLPDKAQYKSAGAYIKLHHTGTEPVASTTYAGLESTALAGPADQGQEIGSLGTTCNGRPALLFKLECTDSANPDPITTVALETQTSLGMDALLGAPYVHETYITAGPAPTLKEATQGSVTQLPPGEFPPGAPLDLHALVHANGLGNTSIDIVLISPTGTTTVVESTLLQHSGFQVLSWTIELGSEPGTWTIEWRNDGVTLASRAYDIAETYLIWAGIQHSELLLVTPFLLARGYRPVQSVVDSSPLPLNYDLVDATWTLVFAPVDGTPWSAFYDAVSPQDGLSYEPYSTGPFFEGVYRTGEGFKIQDTYHQSPQYHILDEIDDSDLPSALANVVADGRTAVGLTRDFGGLQPSGIWFIVSDASANDPWAVSNVLPAQVASYVASQSQAGRTLRFAFRRLTGGPTASTLSLVFDSRPAGSQAVDYGLTIDGFRSLRDAYTAQGKQLQVLVTYENSEGDIRYLAVWEVSE